MAKNLLLISLDTVRADVAYSGQFPTIEKLRKQGVTFLNTISSVPLTPPSHASVFTGLQPYNHGLRHLFKEKLNPRTPTMASLLKRDGYQTGAIVSCPGMNRWYGFSKGFDRYDDEIPRLADGSDPLKTVDVKKRGTALKRASLVVERAKCWLQQTKTNEPFFLFIHFFDAHWPYEAPEVYGGNNPYEEEVAYTDHYLGTLLAWMKKNNFLENTTIVCFSDHGEDLEGWYENDKGGKKLGHPEESGHGCLLYDQTQKVVFIINDESLSQTKNISEQVRLIDILPTTLDLLGLKRSSPKTDGISLVPGLKTGNMQHLPAYSETFYPEEQSKASGKFREVKNKVSYRLRNTTKCIQHLKTEDIEVYDLTADPLEKTDLTKSQKNI